MTTVTIQVSKQVKESLTFNVPTYFRENNYTSQICRLNLDKTITGLGATDGFLQIVTDPYPGIEKIVQYPQVDESVWNDQLLKAKEVFDKFFSENPMPEKLEQAA